MLSSDAVTSYMPFLLSKIESQAEERYLLLLSLSQVLAAHADVETMMAFYDRVEPLLPILFQVCPPVGSVVVFT